METYRQYFEFDGQPEYFIETLEGLYEQLVSAYRLEPYKRPRLQEIIKQLDNLLSVIETGGSPRVPVGWGRPIGHPVLPWHY